jgi:light-regulated signal transduction histidine kinase (bacteriophytochrome)
MVESVDLSNCDREPIHIPGAIQPHGALLCFDADGRLVAWSSNARGELGLTAGLGASSAELGLPPDIRQFVSEAIRAGATADEDPQPTELVRADVTFDVVAHTVDGRTIVEFERRRGADAQLAEFPLLAHRSMDRLRRARSIDELLGVAAAEVRRLTGFDRVMSYRFRHDDSGDIAAEARREDLPPFLGRRYPASDIPAQARRLYVINTLRLIADVGYRPAALEGLDAEPLDLSHSVLRSVSPIHVEYLKNMGVGASMSISIVVGSDLWGMLACHHMGPKHVEYRIRMACDVLAQLLASRVQVIESRQRTARVAAAAALRSRLAEALLAGDDMVSGIAQHGDAIRQAFSADAVIVCQQGKLMTVGEIDATLAEAMLASLPGKAQAAIVERSELDHWPAQLRSVLGPWVGLLGLNFDPAAGGWLILLRREQLETVSWGGKPEKSVVTGPNGPRLTPRGSFDLYEEIVRGKAEPWTEAIEIGAREMLAELHRVAAARHSEIEVARRQLMATLGHDLRDPLQSITMATAILRRGAPVAAVTERLDASSERMRRLISSVMDLSRIEAGLGLAVEPGEADLGRLVRDLLEEARMAYPSTSFVYEGPDTIAVHADPDRISQVVTNLVSNARHHGKPGHPIEIHVRLEGEAVLLSVRNVAPPISEETAAGMFRAFAGRGGANASNRTGLGLGLFIADNIVRAHGSELAYSYASPHVVFGFRLKPA